jgi:hypothetical protein
MTLRVTCDDIMDLDCLLSNAVSCPNERAGKLIRNTSDVFSDRNK